MIYITWVMIILVSQGEFVKIKVEIFFLILSIVNYWNKSWQNLYIIILCFNKIIVNFIEIYD